MSLKYVGVALSVASVILIMSSAVRAADDIVDNIKTVQLHAAIIIEGIEEEAAPGDPVMENDVITTGPTGSVGMTFTDNARISLGYNSTAYLRQAYPTFFWNGIRPNIKDALGFLQVTRDGKAWIANLYGNVLAAEHGAPGLGRPS